MDNETASSVLIVEDEPLVRMIAAETVIEAGAIPIEASNAAEALQVLGEQRAVQVLFTDVNMPGPIDGMELARRIHTLAPQVEIIVTSGRHRISDADLPDHGTFLPKPYATDTLARLLRKKLLAAAGPA